MRPFSPFCGTVSNAQLLTLPATIRISANGVVTIQLSFLPPASSSATDVPASSDSRPATAQPPEPAPTTTKSNVSVTKIPPSLLFRHCEERSDEAIHTSANAARWIASLRSQRRLGHEPQHLLKPRDLAAIRRIEIGHAV